MRKVTKNLLLGFSAVLLILVIAVCALPFLIDPNSFKTEIAALIKDKTGRDVVFEGDIKLSVFPWVGVSTGKITVSNKPGFQELPFITVTKSDIKLKLLPLLSQQFEVNNVALDGLSLYLIKDKQGNGNCNWAELIAPGPSSASAATRDPKTVAPESALAALSVGGIAIQNAKLNWDNQQTGGHLEFANIQINTDKFVLGEPVKIALAMDVSGKEIKFPGAVKVATELLVDDKLENFVFKDSHLDWQGANKPASDQPLAATLSAPNAEVNVKQQTLITSGLQIQSGEIKLTADINGEHILDKISLMGTIAAAPFNPRLVFKQWGIALPNMSDPKAMTNLGVGFQFKANADQVELTDLDVALDNSHGSGSVTVKDFTQPSVLFDFTVDTVDLDRYLAPRDKSNFASPGVAMAAGTFSVPLDWLKRLDTEGKLVLGKMTFNKMTMQDMQLTLSSKNGLVNIGQTARQFYQGSYSGNLNIDTHTDKSTVALNESLTDVHLEALLKAIKGKTKLGGIVTATSQLQGQGNNMRQLQPNFSGKVSFFLKDGFIKGFNLEKMIENSKNLVKGGNLGIDAQHDQTAFSEIKGTATIDKGLLQNDDLIAKTAKLRSTGKGNANLDTGQLDYTLTTKLLKAAATAAAPEQLHNTPIVIHLGGTFDKPTYTLDVAALLTDKNKAKIERFLDKNKNKIDKLMNKLDKKLGPGGASDLLKKIF